jgi:hypothetical protein
MEKMVGCHIGIPKLSGDGLREILLSGSSGVSNGVGQLFVWREQLKFLLGIYR